MTIEKLIEELQNFNGNVEVCISSQRHAYSINSVNEKCLEDENKESIHVIMIVEGYQKYPFEGIQD